MSKDKEFVATTFKKLYLAAQIENVEMKMKNLSGHHNSKGVHPKEKLYVII